MRLDRGTFESWAQAVTPKDTPYSLSKVAISSGIPKSSLLFQARRGYIEASVVIAYSRALGVSPLQQLLRFDQLAIYADTTAPSDREVLTQVPPESYMQELLNRLRGTNVALELGPIPGPYAMKRWLDSYALWGHYDRIASHLGLASRDRLSHRVNRNRLTLGELTQVVQIAELNPRFALVVSGLLSLEEADFSAQLREETLAATASSALVDVLGNSLQWLSKRADELPGVSDVSESISQ